MVQTFKQYLAEASVGADMRFKTLSIEEAALIAKKHCADAINNKVRIYRGERTQIAGGFALVDPSKTMRKSQNTSNFYTVLLDNLPVTSHLPKRSRSMICASDYTGAAAYSSNVYFVFPYDGVPIGETPKSDIWWTQVAVPFANDSNFKQMNSHWETLFTELGISTTDFTFNDFKEIDRDLKADEATTAKAISNFCLKLCGTQRTENTDYQSLLKKMTDDFIGTISFMYDPKWSRLSAGTTASLKLDSEQEVWVSGPCLLVDNNSYSKFMKEVKK